MQTGGLTAGQNFSTGAAQGMKIVFEQLGYDTEGTDVMCPLHFGLLVSAFMTNMNKPLILKQARQQCQSSWLAPRLQHRCRVRPSVSHFPKEIMFFIGHRRLVGDVLSNVEWKEQCRLDYTHSNANTLASKMMISGYRTSAGREKNTNSWWETIKLRAQTSARRLQSGGNYFKFSARWLRKRKRPEARSSHSQPTGK